MTAHLAAFAYYGTSNRNICQMLLTGTKGFVIKGKKHAGWRGLQLKIRLLKVLLWYQWMANEASLRGKPI